MNEPIAAEFYKLLIYDQGSFFVSHRDTEKSPGMFATLVVVLPSASTGGELVIRHKGREVSLALHGEEPSEAVFAAFYADCPHEVLPVTSGCRLTLVCNLLRKEKGPAPEPPITRLRSTTRSLYCENGPPPRHRRMMMCPGNWSIRWTTPIHRPNSVSTN